MDPLARNSNTSQDKTADFLLAIGVGFLINLILGAGLPQAGPLIAGLVVGVIVKLGPLRGGAAGLPARTLSELGSIGLWGLTILLSLPGALVPLFRETAFGISTVISA